MLPLSRFSGNEAEGRAGFRCCPSANPVFACCFSSRPVFLTMDIRFLGTVPADAGFLSLSFGCTPGACPACSGRFLPPFFLAASAGRGSAIRPVRFPWCSTHSSWSARVAATYRSFACPSSTGYSSLVGSRMSTASNSSPFVYSTGRTMIPLLNSAFSKSLSTMGMYFFNSLAAAAAFSRFLHTTAMVSKPFACQSLQTLAAFFISRAVSVTSDTFTGSP